MKQGEIQRQKMIPFKVPVKNERDILAFRRRLTELAREVGMSVIKQTKMMTASSEIARNMLKYSSGGEVIIECLEKFAQYGIRLTFEDKGPGIANLELAMQDGFSSSGSMGIGLPGAKRLASDFNIHSVVGKGTSVSMAFW